MRIVDDDDRWRHLTAWWRRASERAIQSVVMASSAWRIRARITLTLCRLRTLPTSPRTTTSPISEFTPVRPPARPRFGCNLAVAMALRGRTVRRPVPSGLCRVAPGCGRRLGRMSAGICGRPVELPAARTSSFVVAAVPV